MGKICCGNAPRVYIDHKWVCSDCGSIVGNVDDTQLNFQDAFEYFDDLSQKNKCTCGADKTFREPTHASYCNKGN